jgi:hypothetical protein
LPFPLATLYQVPAHRLGGHAGFTPALAGWFCLGIALQFALYYLGYRRLEANSAGLTPLALFGVPLLAGLALLAAAPVTSSDIYYYIMGGHLLADLGLNPMVVPPAAVPNDPLLPLLYWRRLPVPYGPLWVYLAGGLRHLAGADLMVNLLAFKLIELAALFCAGGIVWRYLRRHAPERATLGVFLLLWNPLALWETAGAGHNGIWAMAAVLLAYLALRHRRAGFAVLPLLTAGVLFKFVPAIFLPLAGLWLIRAAGRRRAAWAGLALGGALSVVLAAAAMAPLWPREGTLGIFQEAGLTARSLGAFAIGQLYPRLGRDLAGAVVRGALYAGFGAIYLGLMWRTLRGRIAPLPGGFYALLAFLILPTLWFEPWYAIGPLMLAALSGERRLMFAALLFSFSAMAAYPADLATIFPNRSAETLYWLHTAAAAVSIGPLLLYWGLAGAAGWKLGWRPGRARPATSRPALLPD